MFTKGFVSTVGNCKPNDADPNGSRNGVTKERRPLEA